MKQQIAIFTGIILIGMGAFLFGNKFSQRSHSNFGSISAAQFKQEISDNDAIILDIRTPEEYQNGHIPGAINIDYYSPSFQDELQKLNKDLSYKIYCNSGNRSSKALSLMDQLQFTDATELSGGIQAWKSAGFETSLD